MSKVCSEFNSRKAGELLKRLIMRISENPAKRANMQGMGMETGMVPFGLMGGGAPNDQVSDIIQVPDNSVGLGKIGKKDPGKYQFLRFSSSAS